VRIDGALGGLAKKIGPAERQDAAQNAAKRHIVNGQRRLASAAPNFLVRIGEKRVSHLGEKAPLPVEVVPFGWTHTAARLLRLGLTPVRRERASQPVLTDGGNLLLDCRLPRSFDPRTLAERVKATVGVVEHGLFLDMASTVFVGTASGVEELHRA